jgi:hypothetical protein
LPSIGFNKYEIKCTLPPISTHSHILQEYHIAVDALRKRDLRERFFDSRFPMFLGFSFECVGAEDHLIGGGRLI